MFAKKKKEAENAALAERRHFEEQQRLAAEARARASRFAAEQPATPKPPERVYLASELIVDEPVLEPVEVVENVERTVLVAEAEVLESVDEPEEAKQVELLEEVSSDMAVAPAEEKKPAKLAKLPSLVDTMLTMNLSKKTKMDITMLLMGQYGKYKNAPEEKAILVECLKKLVADLACA